MKIYSTKHALEKGIQSGEGTINHNEKKAYVVINGRRVTLEESEYYTDPLEAIKQANKMKDDKIHVLKRQIVRLEYTDFRLQDIN